jgi:hypothetical protein
LKIIFIVAADLARDTDGKIIVGPETQIACDRAIKLLSSSKNPPPDIIATAGKAGRSFDYACMSDVIGAYIKTHLYRGYCAHRFNTSGEMQELAMQIEYQHNYKDLRVTGITLTVKWWHAPRAWLLCKYWLRKYALEIPVSISWCPTKVGWKTIATEFFVTLPQNILRLLITGE